ncbi:MAG: thioredoxin domain-containing protein [Desulfuromonadales bacterium]|nr:thioredoxin domain-containing protein [Desulfuromonadales bacterium]
MNHLQTEKSPYLLQHIDNPVDWYPWSEQAFARARNQSKLIFLSVGYSTCHWCHVMAHECFEDAEVAELLNRDFVSIKVDREERPDIDQVYMEVCQRLTGSGGWPLTIIMTPDASPFYAATYIPKHGRHGRPGMMELLPWVTTKWQDDPDFLCNAAQEIVAELQADRSTGEQHQVNLDLHAEAEQTLKKSFDSRYGGFGQAPKFPRPHDLTFLLQQYRRSGDATCLQMVEQTLQSMRYGGIYDQLGFGFHRYATDEKWLLPHFEKMLYDQAGLALAYLEAWQITGTDLYAATVREILSYLLRDMTAAEGGIFSAEDADSEGVEGKFYLWSKSEIADILGTEATKFCQAYNVLPAGNYRDEMTGQITGGNILNLSSLTNPESEKAVEDEALAASRKRLFDEREKRIRPHLDDKIITAWNAMAISAFAGAGRLFGDQGYIETARRIADFVLTTMRNQDGRLFRRYRQGEAVVSGFSEDYAFMARGLLDLYAADFDPRNLVQAIGMAKMLRQFFQDPESGRLYDTPSDGEKLLVRPSSTFDGAMPAASSISLEVFARLFLLTGESMWQAAADQLLRYLSTDVSRYPAGYTQLLQSANWLLQPTREVVIVGSRNEPSTKTMLAAVSNCKLPQTVVIYKPNEDPDTITALAPFTKDMPLVNELATAYVCQNFSCRQPVTDANELQATLNSSPG